jgi:CBS domain-containing protein
MKPRIATRAARDVVTVTRATSVATAAELMRRRHVGAVVVVDESNGHRMPRAVLTDRDIVVEVVAPGLDARTIAAGEIARRPLVTIDRGASPAEIVRAMAIHGVRRLPLVDATGALAGIVALDDVLLELAAPLVALGDLPVRERSFEAGTRPG